MTLRGFVSCTLLSSFVAMSPFGMTQVQAFELPPKSIVIGEIAWAGSSLSTADEWIELWNTGDSPVSITGWSLVGAGESGKIITFSDETTVPAHGTFLVSNYASTDSKSSFLTQDGLVTTVLSLSNSNQQIFLYDADGDLADESGDGSAPFAGASLPIKTSMVRVKIDTLGSVSEAWTDSSSAQNIKPGVPDLGTPGVCDLYSPIETPDIALQDPINSLDEITSTTTEENLYESSQLPSEISTGTSSEAGSIPPPATEPTSTLIQSLSPEQDTESATAETGDDNPSTSSTTVLDETVVQEATTTAIIQETSSIPPESPATEAEMNNAIVNQSSVTDDMVQTETPSTLTIIEISNSIQETDISADSKPNYAMLRLNEIMPNPLSGKEWVEIVSLDNGNSIPLSGCMLHDSQGKIFTISDIILDTATESHIIVELTSAKLNNDGDSVALYDPDGKLVDVISYTYSEKGNPFIRYPDKTGEWQLSLSSTPSSTNILTQEAETQMTATENTPSQSATENISQVQQSTTTVTPPANNTVSTTSTVKVTSSTTAKTSSSKINTKTVAPTLTAAQIQAASVLNKKTTTTKAPVKISTPAKPAVKLIPPLAFDMRLSDEYGGTQVQLRGTVGTPPGLLTGNAFILLAPDGQGIKVTVPTSKLLPSLGANLSITGVLRFSNLGYPSLQMGSKDKWTELTSSSLNISPRLVDLISLNPDDAWSFINVTGTVKQVKDQTVTLDLGDMEIAMIIRAPVDYRAKRLVQGDIVAVKGVLEITSQNEPRILPRSSDEIVLISHAEPKTTAAAQVSSSIPNWLPLGAAAGAVVVTESVKQVRRKRKHFLLEKKVAELETMEN
ncbi:MAG: lamin tail domain-containing protein [Patescibacteria group bacterium]